MFSTKKKSSKSLFSRQPKPSKKGKVVKSAVGVGVLGAVGATVADQRRKRNR